ncbi:unnamed protein product, partial [Polarella glacialis]
GGILECDSNKQERGREGVLVLFLLLLLSSLLLLLCCWVSKSFGRCLYWPRASRIGPAAAMTRCPSEEQEAPRKEEDCSSSCGSTAEAEILEKEDSSTCWSVSKSSSQDLRQEE